MTEITRIQVNIDSISFLHLKGLMITFHSPPSALYHSTIHRIYQFFPIIEAFRIYLVNR